MRAAGAGTAVGDGAVSRGDVIRVAVITAIVLLAEGGFWSGVAAVLAVELGWSVYREWREESSDMRSLRRGVRR